MNNPDAAVPFPRSTFVTVVAWIFIVVTGFSTFISILQNVMLTFMFPVGEMQDAMHSAKGSENVPEIALFMFSHIRLFFVAFLVLSAAMFVSSIGLLKRRNWARIAFVFFFALGIAWSIASVFLQNAFFSSMPPPSNAPSEFREQFESMTTVMLVFSSVMSIGFSLLFAWLIRRLSSRQIKGEFQHVG